MSKFADCALPIAIGIIVLYGALKKVKVFDCFADGGREGMVMAFKLAPTLIGLIVAVNMLSVSGAFDMLENLLAPIADKMGFPVQIVPLVAIRPFSGSGALAIFQDIITQYGPDSFAGQVASVVMGSTETTFYAAAVYFSAVGITKTRYTIPCALLADMCSFVFAVTTTIIFLK